MPAVSLFKNINSKWQNLSYGSSKPGVQSLCCLSAFGFLSKRFTTNLPFNIAQIWEACSVSLTFLNKISRTLISSTYTQLVCDPAEPNKWYKLKTELVISSVFFLCRMQCLTSHANLMYYIRIEWVEPSLEQFFSNVSSKMPQKTIQLIKNCFMYFSQEHTHFVIWDIFLRDLALPTL